MALCIFQCWAFRCFENDSVRVCAVTIVGWIMIIDIDDFSESCVLR